MKSSMLMASHAQLDGDKAHAEIMAAMEEEAQDDIIEDEGGVVVEHVGAAEGAASDEEGEGSLYEIGS